MVKPFAEWLPSLLPPPLAGRFGKGFARTLGLLADQAIPPMKDAAKSSLVLNAPTDALPLHGLDRQLPQAPGEDLEAFRARLAAAWDAWRIATSSEAIRTALTLAGLGDATLFAQRELPMAPAGALWARFTVVFTGRAMWDGTLGWDDDLGLWDERLLAPIEALSNADVRAQLRAVIRPWKAARDRVTAAIVARGALLYDTGEAWDDGVSEWDDAGEPTELSSETWDDSDVAWDDPDAGVYDFLL